MVGSFVSFQWFSEIKTYSTRLGQQYLKNRWYPVSAFVIFQPLAGWREVKVTARRTKQDFVQIMH
ncbi:MAG: hypothetical protein DPW16_03965 [Chloroflexi bacterium]|nr:hypothetical protein [Chloroflexota bacterium]